MPEPVQVPADLRVAILAWYGLNGRSLAFRRTADPYAILVSEAMAQQTQAARAAATWERFMAHFPTVDDLAAATPADVLRAWQGLGYDRRALNLWRAARVIVDEHGGRVPADVAALEALPGVGPYTARAVAALAYDVPVGAVDTNVRRVLGRIVAGDAHILSARDMQAVADAAVPPDQPGAWTHALMDIGATVCRTSKPRCDACPARPWCRYVGEPSAGPRARSRVRAVLAPRPPFTSTNRWLRGRILDRLRAATGNAWVAIDGPIGGHDQAAVQGALSRLAADGLIELDGSATARLRVS